MKTSIIKHALANSLLTVLYIIFVAGFLFNAQWIFPHEPSVVIPIGMLLLFVFSATVCGSLVLGRPIIWFLDGKKKEAVSLFGYTILFFFLAAVIVFTVMTIAAR